MKEEAFRSPSSPEEDPPRTSSAEKGRGPNYKVRFRLKLLRYKSRISLKRKTLLLLTARWRAGPLEGLVRPRGSPASGPLTRILSPRFEATVSRSSEAALFFPLGEELSIP